MRLGQQHYNQAFTYIGYLLDKLRSISANFNVPDHLRRKPQSALLWVSLKRIFGLGSLPLEA